jgi:RHS repeat-associated protein
LTRLGWQGQLRGGFNSKHSDALNRSKIPSFLPTHATLTIWGSVVSMNMSATHLMVREQNSVIAISDAVGNPVVRRGYGTYGETDAAQMIGTTSAGSSAHPFGYTGRRWDPDLGLYYYRARWYDPTLGTFLETDPIGALDYVNLYSYVALEPGNATDPTGLESRGPPRATIGSPNGSTPSSRPTTGYRSTGMGSNVPPPNAVETSKLIASTLRLNAVGATASIAGIAWDRSEALGLQRSLISESQISDLKNGGGIVLGQAKRATFLAQNYGGLPSEWEKVVTVTRYDASGYGISTHAWRNSMTNQLVGTKSIVETTARPKALGGN